MNHKKIFRILILLAMTFGIGFGPTLQISAQENITTATTTGALVSATTVASSPLTKSKEILLVPETVPVEIIKQAVGAQVQNEPIILNAPKGISGAMKASTSAASITGAVLTIFFTSSGTSSSNTTGHAFITVKNVSTGGLVINVGNLSKITSGKTVSLGTWSNTVTTEHNGLWYDLESYKLIKNGAFTGRVSVSFLLNATQLNNLNSYIINNDYWSYTSPCSSFAVNAWNSAVDSSYRLSAGTPSTPTSLKNNIQSKFKNQYTTNGSIPYDYIVYYAKGVSSPVKSGIFK